MRPATPVQGAHFHKGLSGQKAELQVELLKVQGARPPSSIVILFEGDGAFGKGGTIKRFTDTFTIRAAPSSRWKTTDRKRRKWYSSAISKVQLPAGGEIVFDRSCVQSRRAPSG